MDYHIVLLLSLVAGSLAGPVQRSGLLGQTSCAKQCTDKSKFGYKIGETYRFTYEGETKTSINGGNKEQSGLKFTATALVEVLSKCELSLKIEDAVLSGSDPNYYKRLLTDTQSNEFKTALEQHPLRFSFQDGIMEELCPLPEESAWVLNIKKGILSSLQNTMDTFKTEQNLVETDVAGKCRTKYNLKQEEWRSMSIVKSKDINTCVNRHGFDTSMGYILNEVPSSLQSLPIMNSSHECEQKISTDGHMESVLCHEVHLFKPFSQGDSGAMTEVTQKLTFVSKSTGTTTRMAEVSRRDTLLFTQVHGEKAITTSKKQVQDKLKELCLTTENGIRPETPDLFAQLVMLMKKLDATSMAEIFEDVKATSYCPNNMQRTKKFYMDAIPMVGTGAAVRQITQLIMNNDVTGALTESWLVSLSFIQHPTKDMLTEIAKMMNTVHGTKILLPMSTLMHTYCQKQSCEQDSDISDILNKMTANLGNDCNGANEEKVILTLRAIGNIEQTQTMIPVLEKCFSRKNNAMGIRVAAVEAYRRMPCAADRNNLIALFRNTDEDSELRLAAYLQVMKCPTDNILQQIKETLMSEEVNQVGSFVWTHLMNLRESSSPYKETVKTMLESDDLPKKFDLDQRKFSRNYEWSHYSQELNMGGMLDNNLIWSPESFVPRSVSANLSVELFGHSVNLLEIGGRAEGLDYLLESYFGPSGYFKDGTINPDEKDCSDIKMKKLEKIDRNFDKKVQELKGAMYARVFGNEVLYNQLGQSAPKASGSSFNFLEMYQELAKGIEISYTKSNMFLDSSLIVPTIIGLPLNLTVNGTVSVDLKGRATIDLTKPHKKILIDGIIEPSGAVEFASMMSVDAYFTKSGIKMTSTLHSSTGVSTKIEIKNKQEYVFNFDLPKTKSEIVTARSELFLVFKDQEKKQVPASEDITTRKFCSGHTIVQLTGLELCGDMMYPVSKDNALGFPLSGPTHSVVLLHKRDSHKGYQLEINQIDNKKLLHFKVFYDTPGSSTERATGFELEVNKDTKILKSSLISPWKKARFTGSLVDGQKEKKLSGLATVDETQEYRFDSSVGINTKGSQTKYKPKVVISYPNAAPLSLDGSVDVVNSNQKQTLDSVVVLKGIQDDPITINVDIKNTPKAKGVTLKYTYEKKKEYSAEILAKLSDTKNKMIAYPKLYIKTPTKDLINVKGSISGKPGSNIRVVITEDKLFRTPISVKGDVKKIEREKRVFYKIRANYKGPQKTTARVRLNTDKKPKSFGCKMIGDYNFVRIFKWAKDKFEYSSKILNKGTRTLTSIEVKSDFKSSRYSTYNNLLQLKSVHRFNQVVEIKSSFDYGRTYTSKVNKQRAIVNGIAKYSFKKNGASINYNVSIGYQPADLDASITGTHSHTQKNVMSNFAIRYEDKNKVTASLRLNDETKKIPKYSGKATLSYPGRDIEIEATGSRKTDSMGDIKLVIQHQKGAKSIVAGEFNQKSNTSVEFASNLKIYNQKPVSLNVATDISLASPKLDMTVVYDNDQYAVMASGEYQQQKYGKIMSHVQYLQRKVAVEVEGGDKEGQYIGKVDVSWDAIRNADKRVLLQSVARVNSWKDFRVISNLEYPGQKIAGELENLIKESYYYKTSGSVSWIPNQWVFAEVKLMDNRKKYRGATEASVSIQTSFQNFEEINVKVGNSYTRHEYEVQAGVTWSKGQTVSVTATSKYPPMIEDLNLDIKMTTPFEAFGNPHVILINKLSSSQKSHSASLQVDWGQKQFVHIETNGENIAYELQKREFTRNIGFSSSILNYEKVIFNITHAENLEKFRSEAAITHNNDKYLYTITMDHKLTGWQLDSRGTFDIKGPYDTMVLIWSHKNTDRDIRSAAEINFGKKQKFTAELTGDIQTVPNHKITSRFQMNVPSSSLRRVDAVFEHENKIGFIKTLAKINADKENIGTIDLNYGRQTSITNVDLQITSKYMDDFRLKSSVESANMPIKSSLEIQWKPYQKITGSFTHSDILNNIESKLTLTTPFPQARSIIIDASHKLNGLDWEAKGAVEYAPMQEITIGGIYNIHTTKKARVYITSPFPTMQRFETGVNFNGNWRKFSTDFDFEINPLVKKITASSEWNHDHLNTHGSVKLNTPFPQYPYMQAEIRRQNKVTSEETSFMIEYLPTQKIEVIGSYVAQPKNLQGTFTVKTPGNMPAVISYRQNGDSNAFVNHAEIIYNEDQKVVLDTTFGIEPKVSGTFHMESPIKGYNTVDFQFSHEGKTWKDLRTQFLYGTNKERIEIETNFDIIGTIEAKAMIKTPFEVLKIAEASFSHDGTFPNLRTNIRGIFNNYSLESNLETSHSMRITGGKINLATTFPAVKFIELAINHEGSLDSFQTHIETTYNQKLIQADTVFSHSDDLTAFTSTLITPLQGWEKTMITFNRDGPLSNFKSTAEIKYQDKKIAASYDHSFKNGDVATTATLFTPYTNDIVFKLDQNQKKRGFTTNIEFTMGTDNEWRSRTNYKLRNNEFILDIDETLIMAGERYTGSFNIDHAEGVLLAFSTKVSGKLQSHSIGTDVVFNAQSLDDISASVKIDSSFKNYTEMDIAATHKLVQGKYKTGVKASLEKKHTVAVTSEVIVQIPKTGIKVDLQTSFSGYESASASIKTDRSSDGYKGAIQIVYPNGEKITADGTFKAELPVVDGNIQVTTPYKGLESVVVKAKSSKSTADFEVRYGDSQKISGSMSHIIDLPTININWAVTTSMNTVSAEFNNKKVGNRYTTTISTNINGKKSSAKSMVSVDLPSIDMEVSIKDSPLKEFVDYDELPSDLTLVVRNQVGTPMIFTDIYLTVDSTENARIKSRINTDDMVGDIVITFLGEKLISISHNAEDKWTRTSNAALKWNDYNHMSTASRCMLNLPDIDCSVTVESTHHKDIQISVMNTVTDQLISSSASAFFGTALRYSGEMTLSPNPSDIQFTLKLLTPHENFTASEVSFTHIEKSKTYSTKLVVSSDKISTITLEGRNRLQTIFDLDLFGKITSDFEAIKLCQLRVTSRKEGDEYIMQVENIMNPKKRTIVDLSVVLPGENQPQSKMHLSIETPFDKLKSFKYKDDGTSNKNDKLMRSSRTVLIQYNGGTYLDIDEAADILVDEDWLLDYKLTFRHPRQMEYSFNSKKENNLFTGESIINWNKADINSNFQVKGQASIVNDKDLHNQVQLEAIHATRTVGIDAILQKTFNTKRSKFIVTWDKDNSKKAGFDLHQDNNKYSTKVVTPTRSIELVNEYDDSAPKVWSENTLYWDADMDTDKKAGIRLTCSSGERNHDYKIDIKLPTFNKEYTISTSTRQTSKLFESTVEFSYSPKRNRNIVMSVRLDDKSTGPQSSNYSWAIGMSQRYSNLDMTLSGHLGQSDDIDTVGANIQYLTNQRKTENLNIFMEIKKLQRKIGLYMHDPKGKSMGIIGRVESTSPLLVTVGCLDEGRHSENLIVKVDENKRSVEIKAKYDSENPNSALHMKAELPTKKDLQVVLYRIGNFEQVTESLINIQLKDSRILHGKINWRPEMFADAMEFTAKRMMKDATEANAALLEVGTEIADELAGKDSKFSKELMDEIQPFAEALAKEIDNFQDELKIFKQKLTEMKRDNDLYLGDMSQFFNNCTQEFIVQYEKALRSMQTTYSDLKTKIIELSNDIKTYPFEKEYTKIVNELSSKFEEYKTEVHSMMMKEVDTMTASIKANIRRLQRKIKELLQKTKAIASEKLDLILQHPDIIKMQQQISERLPAMPEYSMVVKKVKSAVKNVDPMKPYNDVVTKVTSVVQSKYEELNQDKDFVKFKILITEIYEELSTGFEFLSIKKQLMDIATQMHSDIKKFIVEDIAEMKILGLDKSRVITFDPENGNIEVEIYMPTGMETLDRLPKIPVTKFRNVMKDFAGKVQTVIPDSDFNLWDIYYRVRPASLHPIDWIPPFKGYAYVAGNRHFITFDGKKFDFSGDCSFVLTRDLVDNNFTVIMNYKPNENIMDNLLVLAEGKTIEIFPDFTVKIDGKPHEFPYMSHKLSLERVGDWIKLDTGRGLIITGDLPSNVFTIEVSGWYFGKLAGILGTYNNEQYDELTTGDNKIVKNEDSFYNSWEVSKKCRPNGNNAVDIIQDESDFKYIKCAKVLKSTDSVLRPCFRQVNPDKAFEMCLNRDDMCAASRFYLHQCRQQGVYLPPPKECVQCVAPNAESFEAGETIRISPSSDDYQPISSADTIFIVEEKPCNKETTKHLGSLVYEVEQELTKAGISNNKYGLIGFNKKGSHSHTMDGQLLNDATNFVKGVESLTFTSYKTDTLDAILQAANYPFRAGVVKNIILLQCGGCSDLKTIQYQQVRHTLQARNIQFHILRDQEFMLGNKTPKQKILGMDRTRKYVLQNSNDKSLENMGYSVDTCSHLALLSNGSIFDSSSLSLKKVRHQKMAIDTISNRIAKSSLPSQCQVCNCEADETGAAKSVCRSCYSEMTDYISLWWNTFRHPMTIEQEINKQFQEFLNAKKGWAVLTA
nr:apolipophorins isoform X7 [Crassostrea gigas]